MYKRFIPILIAAVAGLSSCNQIWDDHYKTKEETVNQTLWEAITSNPDYSVFADYLVENNMDSIFREGNSLTLFIPTNAAFESFNADTGDINSILKFHVMNYVFNTVTVRGARLAETSGGKFVPIEFDEGTYRYNGINISYFSPLYLDGRFYVLDEVAIPKPNLYEYITQTSPPLKDFIDSYDSVILDYELSKPLGFDEFGNIVYDSVYSVVNYFDSIWFPVKQEDRYIAATFLTFSNDQYTSALDRMAGNLIGDYNSAEDIPLAWQYEVLMPDLVDHGLFQNILQYEELLYPRLKNVRGDSVDLDATNIDPDSKTLASNGVMYSYIDFDVPEYLYLEEIRIEGEHLIDSASGIFIWSEDVNITGSEDALSVFPSKIGDPGGGASNDSSVLVQFPSFNYDGNYQVEFFFKNMFPMKYLFVWGSSFNPSGTYEVYVNDELVRTFDTFDLFNFVESVIPGKYYFKRGNYNAFDAWVENVTEFGDIKITLKYIGPSERNNKSGLYIDYISLIPQL